MDKILPDKELSEIPDLEKIRQSIPSFMSEKRLNHTLSVEKETLSIAKYVFPALGIPESHKIHLQAAALLHDITKEKSNTEQLELCKKYKIELSEQISYPVLHGKTGAYLAKDLFTVNEIVFSAIFNHTTGHEDMDVFEKIIFLADYIEPTRTAQSCINVRNFFYYTLEKMGCEYAPFILDEAVRQALGETLNYLTSKGLAIDLQTVKAYEFLQKQTNIKPFPTNHKE